MPSTIADLRPTNRLTLICRSSTKTVVFDGSISTKGRASTMWRFPIRLFADGSETGLYLVGGAVIFLAGIVFIAVFARYFSLWIQCKMTRAGIGLLDLIMMSFRKVNTSVIVRGKIMSVQAGL